MAAFSDNGERLVFERTMVEANQEAGSAHPFSAGSEGVEAFAHLALRAEAFVAEQGGRASEDLLISHVFGSAGTPNLWRPLLRTVLEGHEGLRRRPDGAWLLAAEPGSDGAVLLNDFVVLDVETTGLQPTRQRIIEIGIARFATGALAETWESLCNPQRRVPAYIVKLTGIDDELLRDAPEFGEVADQVLEWLAGKVIVGHNVEFDLSFLNAELKRLERPPVVNERIDTLALASKLIVSLRKPTLRAVAGHLGLEGGSNGRHRAGPDASLTGAVAIELFRQAWDAGFRSLDEVKSIARAASKRPKERMPRASSVVDRGILAGIPHAPGVYIMRDANERVVYVGKAKDLRDRVGSYFSQPLGYTRKMDGLIESLSRVQVEVVGSELEALLLESQLIRRYQPRYNSALRSHEQYPFIRIDVGNAWPRVSLAKARKDDGARYFGPFRSAATARKTVDLINRVVPLRTCTRSFRDARSYGSPCLQLDLGRCLGPCVGRADRDRYMALVRSVVDYVDGKDVALQDLLWEGLEEAATSLDFERAARLRRDLQASLSLTAAQRRLRESAEAGWFLLVTVSAEASAREVMVVLKGRIWAQLRVEHGGGVAELASRFAGCWQRFCVTGVGEPDHDSVDDMHILASWVARHDGHPAILGFATGGEPDWRGLAKRVLALRGEELDFDAWRKARDLAEADWGDVTAGAG